MARAWIKTWRMAIFLVFTVVLFVVALISGVTPTDGWRLFAS
jgi:hypothetical protein